MRRRRIIGPSFPYLAVPVAGAVSSSFTGPLDIAATSAGAWGMRALQSTIAGSATKIVNIQDSIGSAAQDFGTNANGTLDTAAIATYLGAHTPGKVLKLYDQSGGTNHLSVAGADPVSSPLLYNSSPVAVKTISQAGPLDAYLLTDSSVSLTQPFTVSLVVLNNVGGIQAPFITDTPGPPQVAQRIGFWFFIDVSSGAETPRNTTGAGAINTWFAVQSIFNGASSDIRVNGFNNTTSGNPGTGGVSNKIRTESSAVTPDFSYFREMILWNRDVFTANAAAIEANQNAFWSIF